MYILCISCQKILFPQEAQNTSSFCTSLPQWLQIRLDTGTSLPVATKPAEAFCSAIRLCMALNFSRFARYRPAAPAAKNKNPGTISRYHIKAKPTTISVRKTAFIVSFGCIIMYRILIVWFPFVILFRLFRCHPDLIGFFIFLE